MGLKEYSCLNCGSQLQDSYCVRCGQKSIEPGVSFSEIGAQISSTVFNIEAPFYRTFKGLLSRPGKTIKEFIQGRRKSYYQPVPYYILAVAIHLFLGYLMGYDPIQAVIDSTGGQDQMAPAQREASYWMTENVNYILPVWILLLSLFDKLFFRKSGFNLAERLTAYLFLIAQYILLSTIVIPLTLIDPGFQMSIYVLMFGYMTFSISQFHGGGWARGIKAFFLTLLSFIIYVVLMNVILISFFSYF